MGLLYNRNYYYCKYYYINNNSEEFIKAILTSSCLFNLKYNDFDKLIIKNLDHKNLGIKNYSEISEVSFQNICKQIFNKSYFRNKENQNNIKNNDFYDQDLVKNFLYGLYNLIYINNICNSSVFRLIMLPFNFYDENLSNEKKYEILFNLLKIVQFSEIINHISHKSDIKYSVFLENFNMYLALILSGFTKIIYENLHENNSEELIRNEMKYNLENYLTQNNIKNFYLKISNNLRKNVELKKNLNKLYSLNDVEIDFDMFKQFCKENKFIIEYFELRKNFLLFAQKQNEENLDNIA